MTGFVYFLRCEGFVKIGWSSRPETRTRHIATAIPFDLVLLGVHPGSKSNERDLHRRFAKHHVRREWFHLVPEIEQVATNGFEPVADVPADFHPLIAEAVDYFGSEAALARKVGCSQQQINRLKLGMSRIGAEHAAALDRVSGGRFPKHRLRPDLFDAPASPVPRETLAVGA